MEQEIKFDLNEILSRLSKLQKDIEILKESKLEKQKMNVIDESMAEIWDNDEDEIWNDY